MSLSFQDLIQQQFLKTFDVEIEGVGTVAVHQISAAQAEEITDSMDGLDGDELTTLISRYSAEFIKGSEVTDEELTAYRASHTANTISTIFRNGMNAAPVMVEAAEKN